MQLPAPLAPTDQARAEISSSGPTSLPSPRGDLLDTLPLMPFLILPNSLNLCHHPGVGVGGISPPLDQRPGRCSCAETG